MNSIKIIFFGSFQHYSVIVLDELNKHFNITAVITTPPNPAGRHMELTPTQVQIYAEKNNIPVFPLENLSEIPSKIKKPDFLVVAGYGKLIPDIWLSFPKILPVNMHPSLLPQYRGAFPAEWAIIKGEKETGVSLVTLTAEFDKGKIIAQEKINIENHDTRETLYAKLYDLGAKMLIETLPKLAAGQIQLKSQPPGQYFYARRITKDDGFIPWEILEKAMEGKNVPADQLPPLLDEAISSSANRQLSTVIFGVARALSGWPGVWTIVKINGEEKRLKLLSLSINPASPARLPDGQAGRDSRLTINEIQLEGKKPTAFKELQKSIKLIS